MGLLDGVIDKTLTRLGYTKAVRTRGNVSVLFAGESPPYEPTWVNWSEEQLERLALTCAWVWSDMAAITNEMSQATLKVMERQGEDLVDIPNHEFEQILARPNAHMGQSFLWRYTGRWFLLRGESYWLQVPNLLGGLAELWPLPASRLQPVPDPKTYISHFLYQPLYGRPPETMPSNEICFFHSDNPFDYHRGLSPLNAYRLSLETDISARTWNRDTFDKGLALQAIVSVPAELDDPLFDKAKADIRSELEDQKRRFLMTRAGDIKVEPISITHKDAEFLANRAFTREEIDRVFGIPAGYWSDKANRANAAEAKATFIEQAVWPLLTLFADQITAQIIQPRYGMQYMVQFEDIRIRDRDLQLKEDESNRKIWTFNEARMAAKLDEYAGPYAELLAELPFPLAIDPAFAIALIQQQTAAEQGDNEQEDVEQEDIEQEDMTDDAEMRDEEGDEEAEVTKAAREDLRRWKSLSLRRLKAGKSLDYEFESDAIPLALKAHIATALQAARDVEEVKAAFAAGFCHHVALGWEGYP